MHWLKKMLIMDEIAIGLLITQTYAAEIIVISFITLFLDISSITRFLIGYVNATIKDYENQIISSEMQFSSWRELPNLWEPKFLHLKWRDEKISLLFSCCFVFFLRQAVKIQNIHRFLRNLISGNVENSIVESLPNASRNLEIFRLRIETFCLGSKCKTAGATSFDLKADYSFLISSESLVLRSCRGRRHWRVECPENIKIMHCMKWCKRYSGQRTSTHSAFMIWLVYLFLYSSQHACIRHLISQVHNQTRFILFLSMTAIVSRNACKF